MQTIPRPTRTLPRPQALAYGQLNVLFLVTTYLFFSSLTTFCRACQPKEPSTSTVNLNTTPADQHTADSNLHCQVYSKCKPHFERLHIAHVRGKEQPLTTHPPAIDPSAWLPDPAAAKEPKPCVSSIDCCQLLARVACILSLLTWVAGILSLLLIAHWSSWCLVPST